RSFLVPPEAARSLDQVAIQDLTRRTPFRLADIYHDCTTTRSAGRIEVTQWVARRAVADEAMAALALSPGSVSFLDADRADAQAPLPHIRLLQDRSAGKSWIGATGLALVCVAVVLAASSVGLRLRQQGTRIDDVDAQLAVIEPKAQQV